MAGSPEWKIYDASGNYQAAARHPKVAAIVVASLGPGATIRWQHSLIVYTEGKDGDAGNSVDAAAAIAIERHQAYSRRLARVPRVKKYPPQGAIGAYGMSWHAPPGNYMDG